ncbi:MAG: S24 family peptidase [Proteobacteria bacterium]|nr:S24 family peptidase [Pseudomonadota bacterium]
MNTGAMNADRFGRFRRPTHFFHDVGGAFHEINCSDNRYKCKRDVANRETDAISICCHYRYMIQEWAKSAIDKAGLSQAAIARHLTERLGRSIDRAAVNKIYKGTRAMQADEMVELSRLSGVPAPEHLGPRSVPLVGYVAAGAVAHFFSDQGEHDRVDAPEGSTNDTVAVEIQGDSLGSFFNEWLVYYDEVRSPVTPDLIGRLCVVGVADGRIMIKKLRRSKTPGLYHLESNTEGTITDVTVEWAARVKNMVPR